MNKLRNRPGRTVAILVLILVTTGIAYLSLTGQLPEGNNYTTPKTDLAVK